MAIHTDEQAEARRAKKKEGDRQRSLKLARENAVNSLYKSGDGRIFLRWLLEVSRAIGQTPFRGDPYATAFACGEQNVGLRIINEITQVDPIGFADLLKENELAARSAREDADKQRARAEDDSGAEAGGDSSGAAGGGGDAPGTYT